MPDETVSYGGLTADLVDAFVQMLVDAREGLGGTRDPKVLQAVALDALSPDGQAVISTATIDGCVVGAVIALVGGSHLFWRRFVLRHPVVGASVLLHRLREGRRRWKGAKRTGGAGASRPPAGLGVQPTDLEEALAVERPASGAGPHLRDSGNDVAFGAVAIVAPEHRGRGIGAQMHRQLFARLSERGITNYRASVRFGNAASVRMFAALGCTIYRYADGWFVAIDLASV